MSAQDIPSHSDILVIGGGPSGSYAATALARAPDTWISQRATKSRSLSATTSRGTTSVKACSPPAARLCATCNIGVEQKVVDFGFCVKPGTALKFDHKKREGYTDFINPNPNNAAWNVTRADFDDILLKHAAENGTNVFEGVGVSSISFSSQNEQQPVAVDWQADTGLTGTTTFKYLVDASGRSGLMSTRYLKNRKFNKALRCVAFWGYWTGQDMYAPETTRENATWLESLTDETGWAWFIPLTGKVSVGIVLMEEFSKAKKAAAGLTGPDANAQHYHNQLKFAPGVQKLLANAKFEGEVQFAGDYSYSAPVHSGPNFRIVGDAGGQFKLLWM
ncbi:hypothetical protein GGX14DRAFT_618858 [Mycena pura]|uniref:Halogenase n=1 Tax=Mycena pura TaxID=153505 RepID=A0AAD6YCH1_9AGAR|nr:hypothetical protein GGX14DRAFT_618858 [Mycena pura]